jgi:EAL domain-containing protein (putative c-di-GMP-specific phosphodiesterase class I)
MSSAVRFLGFAFASADILVEIDKTLTISFAAGALSEFAVGPIAKGENAADLFAAVDAIKVMALIRNLPEAGRVGPLEVQLADGRVVHLCLCRLPQDGDHIFCTLSHPGSRRAAVGTIDTRTGLIQDDGFLQLACQRGESQRAVIFVDIAGFSEALARLPPQRADRLLARMGAVLRAAGTYGAGEFGLSTFAVICPARAPVSLEKSILDVLGEEGLGHLRLAQCRVDLSDGELSEGQCFLALRHCARLMAGNHSPSHPRLDIAHAYALMNGAVDTCLEHLTEMVLKSHLHVVVMPVIRLNDGACIHYRTDLHLDTDLDTSAILEAAKLVSPAEIFDLTLVSRCLAALTTCSDVKLAVSISGHTLATPIGCSVLCSFLAAQVGLCGRLKIIITGSNVVEDLERVARTVMELQTLGIEVGLAETGSGAELLRWLPAVHIDFVSFGSGLVQALGQDSRQFALIQSLVGLCRELGVATIAEGVEADSDLAPYVACGFELIQRLRPEISDSGFAQEMRERLDGIASEQI